MPLVTPFFSVIIPTLNEEKSLPKLLTDLSKQSFSDFEVVIVDSQSTDKTLTKARSFSKKLNIQTITSNKQNVGRQRNLGVLATKSQWIIFMDADNRLPLYFLLGIKYRLEQNPSVNLFSCWMNHQAYSAQDRPLIQLSNFGMELYSKIKPIAPGALIGVRRTIARQFRFNENLAMSEDHQYVLDITKAGYDLKYFRDPRYTFSLRRFKKDGTLKILRTYAQVSLKYLAGQKVNQQPPEYPMKGGAYYDEPAHNPLVITQMFDFLHSASKKQLDRAIKVWDYLTKIDDL